MKRLPNLNVLRFFLAAIVVIFHVPKLSRNQALPFYDALPIFHRGKEAVFMFFVISGFLIIRQIYKAKMQGTFSIKTFYIRRILRIFPLYYLIVVFGLIFYNVILPHLGIPFEVNYELPEAIFLNIFFLPNIFAIMYKPGGILEILWSIGIEEQFYLVIAPIIFYIKKNRVLQLLIAFTILYFILFHFVLFESIGKYQFYFYFLFSGGLIAVLEEKNKLQFLKSNKIFSVLIVFLTALYFLTNFLIAYVFWLDHLIKTILFSFFIYTIACNNRGIEVKSDFLEYLGKISYGIYMFHVLALNSTVFLFLKIESLTILPYSIIVISIYSLTFVITILMAHLSYKYFESYFLKLKHKYRV